MFKELILQNPIISLLLITIPTAAIVWKVIQALYVKPRDFRISTMEKDIDTLRNEMLKVERIATNPKENTKRKVTNEQEPSEVDQKEGADSEPGLLSVSNTNDIVLNDLQDLLNLWNNKKLTDLQKKHIEDTYTNKTVVWEVIIQEIGEVGEVKVGKIYVSVISPKAEFSLDSAVAYFDKSYKEALLLIKKGEVITISGVIERFFLSPVLKDCQLIRK